MKILRLWAKKFETFDAFNDFLKLGTGFGAIGMRSTSDIDPMAARRAAQAARHRFAVAGGTASIRATPVAAPVIAPHQGSQNSLRKSTDLFIFYNQQQFFIMHYFYVFFPSLLAFVLFIIIFIVTCGFSYEIFVAIFFSPLFFEFFL